MLGKRHKSGAQKRKEKKQDLQLRESQKGALHRFFPTSRNVEVSRNQGQQHEQPIITQADGNDGGTDEQILEAQDDANDGGTDEHILDAQDEANDDAKLMLLRRFWDQVKICSLLIMQKIHILMNSQG
jgi:hypothetical protein